MRPHRTRKKGAPYTQDSASSRQLPTSPCMGTTKRGMICATMVTSRRDSHVANHKTPPNHSVCAGLCVSLAGSGRRRRFVGAEQPGMEHANCAHPRGLGEESAVRYLRPTRRG